MSLLVAVLVASLVAQVTATVLAVRLVRVTGRRRAWLVLAMVFLVMAARRAFALAYFLGGYETATSAHLGGELLALLTSVLIVIGVALIGPVFRLAGADAAEARRLADGFGASERRLRLVLDAIPDAFLVLAEGRVVFANRMVKRVLGHTAEDAIGMTLAELGGPALADVASVEPADGGSGGSWDAVRSSVEIVRAGEPAWVDVAIRVASWDGKLARICLISDATEQRLARQALAREQSLFAAGPVVLFRWQPPPDRRVSFVTDNVRQWGFDPQELTGQATSFYSHIHPDDRDRVLAEAQAHVAAGEERWEEEYRLVRPDGEERWVYDFTVVQRDEGGEVAHFDGYLLDVTERRFLESRVNLSRRLEAVGSLAGGVAHDFNNLLTAILASAELLQLQLPADDEGQEEVRTIKETSKRAAELTHALLAFARRQVLQPVDADLNSVVDAFLPMLRRVMPESIEVDFIAGHDLATVRVDRAQMEQVLTNLALNARDAMPDGGRFTIETENTVINGEYLKAHPWAREGRYVLLSVSDSGRGMDEGTVRHAFEPFFRTRKEGAGSGLGLATVYGIVKQHEGMINIYSEPGSGTTVKIYLPSVARRAVTVGTKLEGPVRGGDETLLVVEDEPSVRRGTVAMLARLGYTVLEAVDGAEALELLTNTSPPPALVLSDVVMPRMGGRELWERAAEVAPDTVFLFSSGYTENAVHEGFVKKTGVHFIAKPYGLDTLARKIRAVLDAAR